MGKAVRTGGGVPPSPAAGRIRKNHRSGTVRGNLDAYLFISPFFLIFFLFTVAPVVMSVCLSFTYYNILEAPAFVGWKNYVSLLLNDDLFMTALKNTLFMALITGPAGYLASLLFAWFINELPSKLRALLVAVFYAPSISGNVYMIWSMMFNGDSYGYINSILLKTGLIKVPVQWLTDPAYMMPVLILVVLWTSLGAGFLSFVAGFQTVDRTLYETGYVEGIKNRWQELWFITLPYIRPQMMFGAVMSITASFSIGDVTTALCGFPSTDYAVHTVLNHMNDYGNVRFEMGYACAIATVLFGMTVGINKLIQRILSKVGS